MRRRLNLAAIVAVAGLALAGCASGSDTGSASPAAGGQPAFQKKDPLKIGYSVYDLQSPYWQAYAAGVKAEAAAAKVEVAVADQKSSQQAQVSGSADLINQNISALIVSPVQPPALPATVTAAHQARIPVVVGDVGAEGSYDAFILSDNRHGGELAAQYFVEAFKDKPGTHKIGVISLHSGSAVGDDRVKGFTDAIKANPGFQVAATLDGNDTVDGGFKAAQDMLSANPDLEGIYAANDPEAQGASRALEGSGKNPASNFVLVGFNGDPPALDLIQQGKQTATIAQDPYGQGKLAVKTAMALLNGSDPGYTDAAKKTTLFPVQVVDSKNLEQFRSSRADQK
jgi:ribose transport system substrate-binding protein